jgi:signal transduction histidine kinase
MKFRPPVETSSLLEVQRNTARVAGAFAHELNNPLQGILSLVAVLSHEHACDPESQQRIDQIQSGLVRMSSIVRSFSVTYENMPRLPEQITVNQFVDGLMTAMSEHGLQLDASRLTLHETVFCCMVPELTRLLSDALTLPASESRCVHLLSDSADRQVILTLECDADAEGDGNVWHAMDERVSCSGLAVLISETAKLSAGTAEFRFNQSALDGIRLTFRTRMNHA